MNLSTIHTMIRKQSPINMENGKISCVLILKGNSSLMISSTSGVKNDNKVLPVVRPTKTEGMCMPAIFFAVICSVKLKSKQTC